MARTQNPHRKMNNTSRCVSEEQAEHKTEFGLWDGCEVALLRTREHKHRLLPSTAPESPWRTVRDQFWKAEVTNRGIFRTVQYTCIRDCSVLYTINIPTGDAGSPCRERMQHSCSTFFFYFSALFLSFQLHFILYSETVLICSVTKSQRTRCTDDSVT